MDHCEINRWRWLWISVITSVLASRSCMRHIYFVVVQWDFNSCSFLVLRWDLTLSIAVFNSCGESENYSCFAVQVMGGVAAAGRALRPRQQQEEEAHAQRLRFPLPADRFQVIKCRNHQITTTWSRWNHYPNTFLHDLCFIIPGFWCYI